MQERYIRAKSRDVCEHVRGRNVIRHEVLLLLNSENWTLAPGCLRKVSEVIYDNAKKPLIMYYIKGDEEFML